MPTYEYDCGSCNYEAEVFQSMKDQPLKKCPKCKKMGLRRKIGLGAGIIFKGSGFYETDFKTKKGKKEEKSSGGSEKKGSEKKADSKKTKSSD